MKYTFKYADLRLRLLDLYNNTKNKYWLDHYFKLADMCNTIDGFKEKVR